MDEKSVQQILKINNETYEKISATFSASRNRSWPDVDYALKKYLNTDTPLKVLDLGCGNGRLLYSLASYKNIDYTGFDNSAKLLAQTKDASSQKKLTKHNISVSFQNQDMLDLVDEPSNIYDVVFLISSFNHIPSNNLRSQVLANIHRLLKKDGLLIMTNWNMWQVKRKNKKSVWYYKFNHNFQMPHDGGALSFKEVITLWQGRHPLFYQAFTLRDLKQSLIKASFKVLENNYMRQDKKVHWWNGHNILTVARKK